MPEIATKYNLNHRQHRYELVKELKRQVNRIFIDEKLAIKVIMDCRTTSAHKFRTRLEFKQYNVNLTNEQSVLTKILNLFEGENMQTKYYILSYRIDKYFNDYKLAIEIDESGHSDRNFDWEIKRKKVIEQKLGCQFIRIDPDKEDFGIFKTVNEIFRHIKQSTKKTLINKISSRLLELEFKSDNITKSKAIKFIVKK